VITPNSTAWTIWLTNLIFMKLFEAFHFGEAQKQKRLLLFLIWYYRKSPALSPVASKRFMSPSWFRSTFEYYVAHFAPLEFSVESESWTAFQRLARFKQMERPFELDVLPQAIRT
jgi:hypothetical protein